MTPGIFLMIGYFATVAIECPILFCGLSAPHAKKTRLAAALWLTACTYPIVVLVIPMFEFSQSRIAYLAAAESFAIVSECVLFVAAFPVDALRYRFRDLWVVAVANVTSFVIGEVWWQWKC